MAGTLIELFRKQDYIFQVFNGTSSIPLVPLIDTQQATSATLIWRVFSLSVTSGSFYLVLTNVMTGPDDPAAVLASPTDSVVQPATSGSTLYAPTVPQPIGRFLRCSIRTVGATAGTVTVTMAGQLLIRDT